MNDSHKQRFNVEKRYRLRAFLRAFMFHLTFHHMNNVYDVVYSTQLSPLFDDKEFVNSKRKTKHKKGTV